MIWAINELKLASDFVGSVIDARTCLSKVPNFVHSTVGSWCSHFSRTGVEKSQ